MQLNGKISTQVKEFFQDPTEHMKKYFKIVEFQRGHREKLNKNRREEQQRLVAQCQKLGSTKEETLRQMQQLLVEKKSLTQENNQLKLRLQELETRHLGPHSHSGHSSSGPRKQTPSGPRKQTPSVLPPRLTPNQIKAEQSFRRLSGASSPKSGPTQPKFVHPTQPKPLALPLAVSQRIRVRPTTLLGQQTPAFLHPQLAETRFRFPHQPTPTAVPSCYPTPLHANKMRGAPSGSAQSVMSSNSRLSYDRVYSFMNAAANKALNQQRMPAPNTNAK